VSARTNTGITTSVPRSAIQLAVSRLGGDALAAFPAAASGNKACEKPLTRLPTAIPTAMVMLMIVTSACSATPATGISAHTIIVGNGEKKW